jgi:hypothetical protein
VSEREGGQFEELRAWAKRMFRYGWGQMEVARLHKSHLNSLKIIPLIAGSLAVFSVFLLLFGVTLPLKLLFGVYLLLMGAPMMLRGVSEGRVKVAFDAFQVAFVTHAAYAFGMVAGALGLVRNPPLFDEPLPDRKQS